MAAGRGSIALVSIPSLVKEVDVTEHRTETDVIDELVSDHHEALELLHRIPSVTDPDQQRDLADTVISEIVRHSVAEEMYVYPAMREYVPNGEQAVEHDTNEHQQLEEVMKQLERVPASEPRFDTLVVVFHLLRSASSPLGAIGVCAP